MDTLGPKTATSSAKSIDISERARQATGHGTAIDWPEKARTVLQHYGAFSKLTTAGAGQTAAFNTPPGVLAKLASSTLHIRYFDRGPGSIYLPDEPTYVMNAPVTDPMPATYFSLNESDNSFSYSAGSTDTAKPFTRVANEYVITPAGAIKIMVLGMGHPGLAGSDYVEGAGEVQTHWDGKTLQLGDSNHQSGHFRPQDGAPRPKSGEYSPSA